MFLRSWGKTKMSRCARKLRGDSLASRLLRVIFGCYVGFAVIVTAVQIHSEYMSAHRRLVADIEAMNRTFGQGLADAMWSFNDTVLRGILKGIVEIPAVVSVQVRDDHDRIVGEAESNGKAGTWPAVFDKPIERRFDLAYRDENRELHWVGRWTVRSNDGIVLDQVKNTLIVIVINSMLKTIALCFIFSLVIRRMVGRPLEELSAFVGRLDAETIGSSKLQPRAQESQEIKLLMDGFNAMSAKLRVAFDDNAVLMGRFKEANATLQARVDERTRELVRLAHTDPLTGLSNRRQLDHYLEIATMHASDDRTFSIILCDIDHFKSINDRYGHAVGDEALVAVAQIMRDMVGADHSLGRWGGEEFLILCRETDQVSASALAEAVRRRIESTALPVVGVRTCSFGVAQWALGENIRSLMIRADAALYAAKGKGRNRVEVAGPASSPGLVSAA